MNSIKELYKKAKLAKVGDSCICPSCQTKFIKTNYQQAFCKSKDGTICKDYYWNNVTPNKRNNTTRISPANAAWKLEREEYRERHYNPDDYTHPFSSEALGQWED